MSALFGLIPWWMKLAIAVAAAIAIYAAWEGYIANPYREEGRVEVRKKWDADKAARIALTTGIVMQQNERNKANDAADDQRKLIMDRDFSTLAARAAGGAGGSVPVAAGSRSVQHDASRAANADRPKTPAADGGGKAAADSVSGPAEGETIVVDQRDVDAAWVEASHAYRDAFDRFLACRIREDTCRATEQQLIGATP